MIVGNLDPDPYLIPEALEDLAGLDAIRPGGGGIVDVEVVAARAERGGVAGRRQQLPRLGRIVDILGQLAVDRPWRRARIGRGQFERLRIEGGEEGSQELVLIDRVIQSLAYP